MTIPQLLKLKTPYRNDCPFLLLRLYTQHTVSLWIKAAKWGKHNVKHINNEVFCLIKLSVTAANVLILVECQDK